MCSSTIDPTLTAPFSSLLSIFHHHLHSLFGYLLFSMPFSGPSLFLFDVQIYKYVFMIDFAVPFRKQLRVEFFSVLYETLYFLFSI